MIPGIHIVADLAGCASHVPELTDAGQLRLRLLALARDHGLSVVAHAFHAFQGPAATQPGGVTGCLVLAESHVTIHTWPERQVVTLDVHVCNVSCDNTGKARALMDALVALFSPRSIARQEVQRGEVWLHERLSREQSHALRSERLVLDKHTGIQRLELHRSRHFGKVLRLDGSFQTSENDEFFYHESLVHTAALVHEHPRTALLIGGGDGGALEELLKHPSMERVTLVELDRGVIEVAREHLRSIHKDAFDDPRVDVVIGDGHDHVLASPHRYDLILLDLPDPGAACERLYASSFFKACASRLTARGLLTLHLGPTTADMGRLQRIHAALAASFAIVRPLRVTVPLYGSEWLLVVCSATPAADPAALSASEVEARLGRRGIPALQYLNGVVYQAALAMPNYLRHALALDAAP